MAATEAHAMSFDALYRAGIAAQLLAVAAYVVVTLYLYVIFEPVDRRLSLVAAAMSLIGIATLAVSDVALLAQALTIHGEGYLVADVFFGIYCAMIGALVVRSDFMPRALGALMAIAGVCYVVDSFTAVSMPSLEHALSSFILVPCLIGEAVFTVWLLVAGVDRQPVTAR